MLSDENMLGSGVFVSSIVFAVLEATGVVGRMRSDCALCGVAGTMTKDGMTGGVAGRARASAGCSSTTGGIVELRDIALY